MSFKDLTTIAVPAHKPKSADAPKQAPESKVTDTGLKSPWRNRRRPKTQREGRDLSSIALATNSRCRNGRTATKGLVSKSTAIFMRPFTFPDFDETLPAGEYDLETELSAPPNHLDPDSWKASVLVHLHPRMSHPGLARSLTVSLAHLDNARAKDKLSGKKLTQFFLEEMLSEPMVRLVMQADGVSETQLRHLYSGSRTSESDSGTPDQKLERKTPRDQFRDISAIQAAENEGMPTWADYAPRSL